MKHQFILYAALVLSTMFLSAQQRTTGVVLDAEGKPVVGASVMVQGTTMGTVTDTEGNFELLTNPNDKLQIMFPKKQEGPKPIIQKRFLLWGAAAMTTRYDIWLAANGEHPFVGGIGGLGYQVARNTFIFTIGAEFDYINYYDYGHKHIQKGVILIPAFFGREKEHWFWQLGPKLGLGTLAKVDKNDDRNSYYGLNLLLGPAVEFGWKFTSKKAAAFADVDANTDVKGQRYCTYKIAFYGQGTVDFFDSARFDIMLGLKFTLGIQGPPRRD